ncbi:MAG TPA: amidase [Allosphingosinicella sp.]
MNGPQHEATALELAAMLASGEISSVKLTEYFLRRIDALDPRYGAFRLVLTERALAQARAADEAFSHGKRLGPLQGVPYAVKDLFDVAGVPTTAGCDLLADNNAATSAAVVQALDRSGMVLLGKTNLVQFAHGSLGINLNQGTPLNPWAAVPVAPGGSSSGSAVAVATGMTPVALGTDTGGSIRVPAALNGIVGLKTTYDRISREGVYPLSPTLDTVGVLATSAADAAILFELMLAAPHRAPARAKLAPPTVKGLSLAFADSLFEGVDEDVARAVMEAGTLLAELGASIEHIPFPEAQAAVDDNPHGLISAVEGYRQNSALIATNSPWLDPMVVQSFAAGSTALAVDYYDAISGLAPLRAKTAAALGPYDGLLAPTLPTAATPISLISQSGDAYEQENSTYARITRVGNVLNLCGVSVPCGFSAAGLPIGLQIMATADREALLLRIAGDYLQARWGGRIPRPPSQMRDHSAASACTKVS